ncbi:hypothetical protein BDF19DRAFT_452888 [Syncephalis fuscata]|nr:hypothetical protein BDF19DRAFT_452888 [Syncephalis fuscata]
MNTSFIINGQDVEWMNNATRLWGIPLHPTGEKYLYEYIAETSGDVRAAHARLSSLYLQCITNMLIAVIFSKNLLMSLRMVVNRPFILAGWCCLIPSLFGIGWTILVVLYFFDTVNCRVSIWYFIVVIAASSISNTAIMLHKAYLVLLKQQWILIVGIVLMVPQLVFMPFFLAFSWATTELDGGCVVHYSDIVPLYWFGVTIPINILFSGIVSYIAYKQYKAFGSEAWKRLTRDGIQTMCLVVVFNVICATIILSKVIGNYSDMFFVADWVITSTILVHHCATPRKRARSTSESANGNNRRFKPKIFAVKSSQAHSISHMTLV